MLLEIDIDDIQDRRLPLQSPQWLGSVADGLQVVGDRVGYRETFVLRTDERVLIATTLDELLTRRSETLPAPVVSPFGVSQVLNHGLAPVPHTVYKGVQRLVSGSTTDFTVEDGRVTERSSFSYPWLSTRSREDQAPSTTRLRDLITSALNAQLESAGGTGMLMLSSGKDSVALALALVDGGHTAVPCVTFKSGPHDHEHGYAAHLCERLGLQHHTVSMPDDPETTKSALLHFFRHSPLPSVDHATIPYAIITQEAALTGGGIIDGSGNDGYMGFLPSSNLRTKHRWRIRNQYLAEMVKKRISHDSRINYLTRSKADTSLPGRMFRGRETRRFYDEAVDTEEFWRRKSSDARDLDMADFLAVTRQSQTESARTNPKIHLAARARGLKALLPFCNEGIADYYFNLPEVNRFDRSSGTNKLLLRQLLHDAIGYDPNEVGVNHFQFDGAAFLLSQEHFVRDEVLSCALWLPEVEPMLEAWTKALPKRPFLYHSLLALFMISGWHNHSFFLDHGRVAP